MLDFYEEVPRKSHDCLYQHLFFENIFVKTHEVAYHSKKIFYSLQTVLYSYRPKMSLFLVIYGVELHHDVIMVVLKVKCCKIFLTVATCM